MMITSVLRLLLEFKPHTEHPDGGVLLTVGIRAWNPGGRS